jgi:hypothetical protein
LRALSANSGKRDPDGQADPDTHAYIVDRQSDRNTDQDTQGDPSG